jgi:hypothetical protein
MREDNPPTIYFGDLDDIEIIEAIEDAFEITLLNEEVEKCFTVGDIYALVLNKFPHAERSAAPCASAAAYYALKRAFRTMRATGRISRNTLIRDLLLPSPRFAWHKLSEITGFNLPRLELAGAGWIVAILFAITVTAAAVAGMYFEPAAVRVEGIVVGALVIGISAFGLGGWLARKLHLVRVPRRLRTVGDLARAVAATNIAKLASANVPTRERDVWASLEYIIRDQLAWKGPITPESRFAQG